MKISRSDLSLVPSARRCAEAVIAGLLLLRNVRLPSPLGAERLYGSLVGNVIDETDAARSEL